MQLFIYITTHMTIVFKNQNKLLTIYSLYLASDFLPYFVDFNSNMVISAGLLLL